MIGSPVVHYRKTGFFLWVLKKGAHMFVCCFPSFVVFFKPIPLLSVQLHKKTATRLKTSLLRHLSCGGRIRTCDLQVMSLASYQLLHSAMLFLICECKGTAFI